MIVRQKMQTCTMFFTTICNIVMTILSFWKHIHPTTQAQIQDFDWGGGGGCVNFCNNVIEPINI